LKTPKPIVRLLILIYRKNKYILFKELQIINYYDFKVAKMKVSDFSNYSNVFSYNIYFIYCNICNLIPITRIESYWLLLVVVECHR